jgi:hypothetical protein
MKQPRSTTSTSSLVYNSRQILCAERFADVLVVGLIYLCSAILGASRTNKQFDLLSSPLFEAQALIQSPVSINNDIVFDIQNRKYSQLLVQLYNLTN